MKTTCLRLVVAASCSFVPMLECRAAEAPPAALPATAVANGEIAEAAKKFLTTLDDTQRGKVVYDFKDEEQRKRWSNLPTTFVKRGGLRLGDLTAPQREAAMAVVSKAFSARGYEKVLQIMEGDEILKKTDSGAGPGGPGGPGPRGANRGGPGGPPNGNPPGGAPNGPPPGAPAGNSPGTPPSGPAPGGSGGGGAGGGSMFGHDEYYISFVGKPSTTEPWMIQFGGHHLAINVTLAGDQSTIAPSHTAAQPAIYELEGKTVRPLGRETDKAFDLLTSLDESQRKRAILGFKIHDLVLGPGRDGQTIQPEGIKGSDLTEKQREMLLDLAGEWTGIQSDAAAKAKMDEMKKDVAETWFSWSGPTEKGAAAYFRIQGPTVFIEYSPQTLGGDATKHIHTIYRDPTNDYGAKWWKK